MSHNILNELDSLIKRASAQKSEALAKEAQDGAISTKLDSAEDGTSSASTGEQAAAMQAAQNETYPDNAADTGAKDSEAGKSVDMSSDDATAASTDGQAGSQGAELEPKKEADNGPTLGDTPKPNGWNSGSFKEAAAALRKQADELEKAAESLLSPLDHFLVSSTRKSADAKIRKQAQAMPDDELADAAAGNLLEQIESGELGPDEAEAIITEALASGAITEEDVAEAVAATEAVAAEDVPVVEDAPEMLAPEGITEEQLMEAKVAAADIGPNDPRYTEKIAAFYPAEINAGYAFGQKLAEELAAAEEDEEVEEVEETPGDGEEVEEYEEVEEASGDGEEVEEVEEASGDGDEAEAAEFGEDMGLIAPSSTDEEAALQAVQQELGVDDAALQQLMAAPIPEEAKMAMAKTAGAMKTGGVDYHTRVRTTILNKVAALRR